MGDLLFWVLVSIVSLVMIIIGLVQYYSKKPVGFFANTPALHEDALSNSIQYNKSHGFLWLCYGNAIMLGTITGYFFSDITTAGIVLGVICTLGVVFLIAGHFIIEKKYRIG